MRLHEIGKIDEQALNDIQISLERISRTLFSRKDMSAILADRQANILIFPFIPTQAVFGLSLGTEVMEK